MDKLEERISINNDNLTIYTSYPQKCHKGKVVKRSIDNLKLKNKSKSLSLSSSKKIKKLLSHWIIAINMSQSKQKNTFTRKRRYLVMITLTLPAGQKESDKEFKRKYFNNFIIQLRSNYLGIKYLWVAEKQKNGNIHFHIIVDRWVDKKEIQRVWNNILNNGTYIAEFKKKFNHISPPSTHIKGQKEMENPINYLIKYVTKGENSIPIEGKKWGCSDELLNIHKFNLIVKNWYKEYLYYYRDELKIKYWSNEHCEVYYFHGNWLQDLLYCDIIQDQYRDLEIHYGKLYEEIKPKKACTTGTKVNVIPASSQLSFTFS